MFFVIGRFCATASVLNLPLSSEISAGPEGEPLWSVPGSIGLQASPETDPAGCNFHYSINGFKQGQARRWRGRAPQHAERRQAATSRRADRQNWWPSPELGGVDILDQQPAGIGTWHSTGIPLER